MPGGGNICEIWYVDERELPCDFPEEDTVDLILMLEMLMSAKAEEIRNA